jgi:hypothetical protein
MEVLETRPGAYRLTPIAGPVNRTCQATTTAVAASTAVVTTLRSSRVPVVFIVVHDRGLRRVRRRRWPPFVITASGY